MVPKKESHPLSGMRGGKGLVGVGGSEVTLARRAGDQRKPAVAQTRKSIVRKFNQVRTIPELNTTRPDVHKHLFPHHWPRPNKEASESNSKGGTHPFLPADLSHQTAVLEK